MAQKPLTDFELLTRDPLVNAKGFITEKWLRAFTRAVGALQITGLGTIWSEVEGVRDWRPLAALLIAGLIRQVPAIGTVSTPATNDTNVYADTGLAVSITPTAQTSKVLVIGCQQGVQKDTGNTGVQLRLLRNAAALTTFGDNAGSTDSAARNHVGGVPFLWLDSPGVVVPVTYKTQFASKANLASARVQASNEVSTIAVLEVLA
jgi:hypothetical protein